MIIAFDSDNKIILILSSVVSTITVIIRQRSQQTERAEDVSELGCVDEALAFSVVSLERFHEVGKRARVRLVAYRFVDGQNLLEPVLLFTCITSLSPLTVVFQRCTNGFLKA